MNGAPGDGGPADESRRTFLGGAARGVGVGTLLLLTAPRFAAKLVTGRSAGSVTVAVGWSGGELRRFRGLMDRYESHADVGVNVEPVGDEIEAYLEARSGTGSLPDVAVLSRPGLVRDYVGKHWLDPVDRLAGRFPPAWRQLVTVDRQLYGAWVKAAHKSLFWYDHTSFQEHPSTWRWADLVAWVRREADYGSRPPLAIGAGDGWVLTDWFENVLTLFGGPDAYRRLARGESCWSTPAVRETLRALAELWQIPNALAGGRRAALMEFDESVSLVATGEATMVLAPDFAFNTLREISRGSRRGVRFESFRFPRATTNRPPAHVPDRVVVGGDVAVVRRGSTAGHRLVDWMTGSDAVHWWIAEPGYLVPNTGVSAADYPNPHAMEFARQLANVRSDGLRFDLSDQLPGALNGADGRGSWLILTDFFLDVTAPYPDMGRAIRRATARFDRIAAGAGCSP